jgi:hypothetical protein
VAEGAAAGGPAIAAVALPVLASGSSAVPAERCAAACLRTNLCPWISIVSAVIMLPTL